MRVDRFTKVSALLTGFVAGTAMSIAGCGGASDATQSVSVTPEVQKKTDDYLQNYQKQMEGQHKKKPAAAKK